MKNILDIIKIIATMDAASKAAKDESDKIKIPFENIIFLIKRSIKMVKEHLNDTDKATICRNKQILNSIIQTNVDIDNADFTGVDEYTFNKYIDCIQYAIKLENKIEDKAIARLHSLRDSMFKNDASDDLESLSKDELIARLREKSK